MKKEVDTTTHMRDMLRERYKVEAFYGLYHVPIVDLLSATEKDGKYENGRQTLGKSKKIVCDRERKSKR